MASLTPEQIAGRIGEYMGTVVGWTARRAVNAALWIWAWGIVFPCAWVVAFNTELRARRFRRILREIK